MNSKKIIKIVIKFQKTEVMISNKEITKCFNYKQNNLIQIIKRNNKIQQDTADG